MREGRGGDYTEIAAGVPSGRLSWLLSDDGRRVLNTARRDRRGGEPRAV